MNKLMWEEIEHTADWAIRVWGEDQRALYENAALGMVSLLGDAKPTKITLERGIEVTAIDAESLLVDWLTELLSLLEDHLIFGEIRVTRIEGNTLFAKISGGPPDEEINKHIKAVTYHLLAIKETERGLETVIVFDV